MSQNDVNILTIHLNNIYVLPWERQNLYVCDKKKHYFSNLDNNNKVV